MLNTLQGYYPSSKVHNLRPLIMKLRQSTC